MEIKKMFFPLPYIPYISFLRWAEGKKQNEFKNPKFSFFLQQKNKYRGRLFG